MTSILWETPSLTRSSKLRKPGQFPQREPAFSSFGATYSLDSNEVDYSLARALYNNTDTRYKLGAGFARPAIDVPVGFMGVPILTLDKTNAEQQAIIDRHLKHWRSTIIQAHRIAQRDGEVLVKLQDAHRSPAYAGLYKDDDRLLELSLFPTESFEVLSLDEDIGAVSAIRLIHLFIDEDDQERKLFETITAKTVTLEYENNYRPTRSYKNPLGFVPAFVLSNEVETNELHARSELEAVEPYLKFYNDVMLHAGSASQLHSTAKLIVRVRDLDRFLTNNFTETEITEGRLRFKNKDVLFFESGEPSMNSSGSSMFAESADIVQARAPLGDTTLLLEFIFLNIVDVTEVPEWAFGGSIASSKASVSEQSGPLVHKVGRKRDVVTSIWATLSRMAVHYLKKTSSDVAVTWNDISMRDLKTEAEAFRNFAESLIALNDGQTISKETMNAVLMKLLPEIQPYDVSTDTTEKARLSSEVEELIEQARAAMGQTREEDEDDDRKAGLRAVGSDG